LGFLSATYKVDIYSRSNLEVCSVMRSEELMFTDPNTSGSGSLCRRAAVGCCLSEHPRWLKLINGRVSSMLCLVLSRPLVFRKQILFVDLIWTCSHSARQSASECSDKIQSRRGDPTRFLWSKKGNTAREVNSTLRPASMFRRLNKQKPFYSKGRTYRNVSFMR
jgi:hypothetical protein